jgi:ribonuclease P protein subunit POP4
MRTQENITKHELIGLQARIINARNSANIGIIGKIVDETNHTIVLEQANTEKRVFKKCVELELDVAGDVLKVNGAHLDGRPWDRIKKKNGR